MYPPLWTCLPVAMHDDIENASVQKGGVRSHLEMVRKQQTNYSWGFGGAASPPTGLGQSPGGGSGGESPESSENITL